MTPTRSLFVALLLMLAAGAWFLMRSDESPADVDPGASIEAGQLPGVGVAAASGSSDGADHELSRAESSAPAGDATERALAAAAGQAVLRMQGVDHAGRAVPAAWASARANPMSQGDFDLRSFGAIERAEGERVTSGNDGRIETSVPAGSALIVEIGGPTQQPRTLRLDPLARGEVLDLGALALQDGGEILGRVLAPDGDPVNGAQVSLREAGSRMSFGGAARRETTDARGDYRFSGLLPGAYQLEADAQGFAPAAAVKASAAVGAPTEAVLQLREGRVLRGQVVDRDRRPIAGAEVSVRSAAQGGIMILGLPGSSSQTEPDAVSAADGRFLLRGLPEEGNARLTVSAQGFANARATVGEQESETLITMTPALTLAGKLVNEKGQGVAGVEVSLERADDEFDFRSFWASRSATSGADGAFAISGLDVGVWRVVAHTATHSTGDLRIDLARDVDDVVARLEPAAVFSIAVTEATDGKPVAGALVMVEPQQESDGGFLGQREIRREVRVRAGAGGHAEILSSGEDRAVTDAEGIAAFSELPEGRYTLRVSAEGYARQQLDFVRERGPQRNELSLQPGANLRAAVEDGSGLPLPGVRVVATPKSAPVGGTASPLTRTTDASGRAVFTGMQPGTWTVDYEAAALEGALRFISSTSAADAGAKQPSSRTGVEAVLVPGDDAEVILRATEIAIPTVKVTRRGKPLANAQVRLEAVSGGDDLMAGMNFGGGGGTRTLADGSARLQPVAPGEYDVVVVPGNGLPERRERTSLFAGEQEIDMDVRGGRISGLAESSSGELRNAVAFLERASAKGGSSGSRRLGLAIMVTESGDGPNVMMSGGPDSTRCEIDSSGRYSFEEVPAGEWTVRITAPQHATWSSERITLAEEQERDLGSARLSAGGVLRGVHRGAIGAANSGGFGANILILMDEQGRQSGMTQPKADGSYEFRDLASGAYTLMAPPGYRSDPIEVRDGATVTHDVPAAGD